jgi:glycosyltransferase involved in cell wall biosynthesis
MISIIIPTYNRGRLIKKSIWSILRQTYQNFELIIVDDNSDDGTEDIVKNIKDNRIRYIKHENNKGANVARNTGISNSTGEYIAFQDSDDEWLEDKLEIQINELIKNKVDVVASSFYRYSKNEKRELIPEKSIKDEQISVDLFYGNFISTQTILGKRECFVEESFDESFPRFQDWELIIRISKKYKVHFINKPLVNVYVQDDSISQNYLKAYLALKMLLKKYIEELEKDKKAKASIYSRIGDCCNAMKKFDENYYLYALKADPINIRYWLKAIVFSFNNYIYKLK